MTYSITQKGKPLEKNKYTLDKKTKTFSSKEENLVLDFSDEYGWTFNTRSECTFNTGSDCTFNVGKDCMILYYKSYKKLRFKESVSLREYTTGTARTLTEKEQMIEDL